MICIGKGKRCSARRTSINEENSVSAGTCARCLSRIEGCNLRVDYRAEHAGRMGLDKMELRFSPSSAMTWTKENRGSVQTRVRSGAGWRKLVVIHWNGLG